MEYQSVEGLKGQNLTLCKKMTNLIIIILHPTGEEMTNLNAFIVQRSFECHLRRNIQINR